MKKIAEYLVTTRKELNDKNASLKERKLALMSVPYLKYMELSQIDFWEENYSDDIELLFNLYVAQGIHHKDLRRIIWNKNDLNYYYHDLFSLKNKSMKKITAKKTYGQHSTVNYFYIHSGHIANTNAIYFEFKYRFSNIFLCFWYYDWNRSDFYQLNPVS